MLSVVLTQSSMIQAQAAGHDVSEYMQVSSAERLPCTTENCLVLADKMELLTSSLVRPISLIMGSTLKGKLMPSWQRYFISSNSPSGGTKLTTFSVLNRPRLTHWWKVTSCQGKVIGKLHNIYTGQGHNKYIVNA